MEVRMKLRVARIESGLSQKELALRIGVSQQTIAKWELGLTTPSHFGQIRDIEKELAAPAERLFPDIFEPAEVLAE